MWRARGVSSPPLIVRNCARWPLKTASPTRPARHFYLPIGLRDACAGAARPERVQTSRHFITILTQLIGSRAPECAPGVAPQLHPGARARLCTLMGPEICAFSYLRPNCPLEADRFPGVYRRAVIHRLIWLFPSTGGLVLLTLRTSWLLGCCFFIRRI